MKIAGRVRSSVTGGGGTTRHADAIIRTVVVPRVTKEKRRHRADDAQFKWVILTRTHFPLVRCVNMDLPAWVVVSEETPRQDRHWVLLVVNVRNLALQDRVDKIRKVLIADARQAVQDGFDGDICGQLQP